MSIIDVFSYVFRPRQPLSVYESLWIAIITISANFSLVNQEIYLCKYLLHLIYRICHTYSFHGEHFSIVKILTIEPADGSSSIDDINVNDAFRTFIRHGEAK